MNRDTIPIAFAIDAASGKYFGETIYPESDHQAHVSTHGDGSALVWEQPNSSGGTFVYSARQTVHDSLVGIVTFRGARTPDGKPFAGSFLLVRLAARSGAPR